MSDTVFKIEMEGDAVYYEATTEDEAYSRFYLTFAVPRHLLKFTKMKVDDVRNRIIAEHKARMAAEHGVEGHPKFERCYQLAWDHGHASGLSEVELYFSEFVTLIK